MPTTFEVETEMVGLIQTKVINTVEDLDQSLEELIDNIINTNILIGTNLGYSHRCVVGFDINHESILMNPQYVSETVSILKLCYENTCLIIQLPFLEEFPYSLSNFLKLNWISFVGIGIKLCVESLEQSYGIKCRNAVDLRDFAAGHKRNRKYKGYGLKNLADEYVNARPWEDSRNMVLCSANVALSNWGVATLSDLQIKSATLDAFVCFYLGRQML